MVVAIIQARMGSSRFPGKMMASLGGHPLLEWVLKRILQSEKIGSAILATSTDPRNDPLEALAEAAGVRVFRGDENDVLGRFAEAAKWAGAESIVRICADNPFVAPEEIDRLVTFFQEGGADYAFNHLNRLDSRYADGFGAEIVRYDVLQELALQATLQEHREHVTQYIWDHPTRFRIAVVPAPPDLAFPELRFDVDTPEDLLKLEKLVNAGVALDTPARDIVHMASLLSEPSLS